MHEQETNKSKKYRLTKLGLVLIVLTGLAAAFNPGLAAVYSTLVGGLLGTMGLYFGGNIGNKFVTGKYNNNDEIGADDNEFLDSRGS